MSCTTILGRAEALVVPTGLRESSGYKDLIKGLGENRTIDSHSVSEGGPKPYPKAGRPGAGMAVRAVVPEIRR